MVSLSVNGDQAVYRYGRPGQAPELTLSSPLTELDYRRADGEEARDIYQREGRKGAGWIGRCDQQAGRYGDVTSCADLAKPSDAYDAAQVARRQLVSLFRVVSTSLD